MHAKMTRDRKKNFIATIEKTIEELERDCQRMRDVLNKVGAHEEASLVSAAAATPSTAAASAPVITPLASPHLGVTASKPEDDTQLEEGEPSVSHAFALTAAAAAVDSSAAPILKQEPALMLSPKQEPTLKPERELDHPIKRVKVAHGFSWDG